MKFSDVNQPIDALGAVNWVPPLNVAVRRAAEEVRPVGVGRAGSPSVLLTSVSQSPREMGAATIAAGEATLMRFWGIRV